MCDETKINSVARMHALGDTAVTVEFGESIDRATSLRVMAAARVIKSEALPGVRELVPTFRSLTVYYDPDAIGFDALTAELGALVLPQIAKAAPAKTWRVPVLYDGPDLADVAVHLGTTPADVAALHAGASYHIYMLGFLPGFAYLGDLPDQLRLPRLKEPRMRVPAGSLAIAEAMTAIYPAESPGGWRLIGRTPLVLFDHRADPPSLFQAGDSVSFVPIGEAEFDRQTRERA